MSPFKLRSMKRSKKLPLRTVLLCGSCCAAMCAQKPAVYKQNVATVPFVGCKSDGQVGPLKAPSGKSKALSISTEMAQRLAYYKAEEGLGILAPRGWYCFATYGSNGSNLYVSPQPISSSGLFSDSWKGFTGPVIQLSVSVGDTSGRFEVAKTIARVFPAHKDFVQQVIAEGIEPASSFQLEPFPADKLNYRSKEIVEYETPANAKGIGTASILLTNSSPIRGVAILSGETPDLLFLAIRFSPNQSDLSATIIQCFESEAAQLKE